MTIESLIVSDREMRKMRFSIAGAAAMLVLTLWTGFIIVFQNVHSAVMLLDNLACLGCIFLSLYLAKQFAKDSLIPVDVRVEMSEERLDFFYDRFNERVSMEADKIERILYFHKYDDERMNSVVFEGQQTYYKDGEKITTLDEGEYELLIKQKQVHELMNRLNEICLKGKTSIPDDIR